MFHNRNPIISYGVILYRIVNRQLQFLYIWPKHSVNYISFLKSEYVNDNDEKFNVGMLENMIKRMSIKEQEMLSFTTNFESLCKESGLYGMDFLNRNENYWNYKKSEKRFYRLVKGVNFPISYNNRNLVECRKMTKTGEIVPIKVLQLSTLLLRNPSEFRKIELGFPKGRKNNMETDMECALREFEEETCISRTKISLILNELKEPIVLEEVYYGSDNRMYKSIFYLAKYIDPSPLPNVKQIRNNHEISMTQWMDAEEALSHIRPYHNEKKHIIEKLKQIISTAEEI